MTDTFITKIQIDKVRHLENITIELSDTERKHLILTGKNGSGKTSVLEAMSSVMALTSPKGDKMSYYCELAGVKLFINPQDVNLSTNLIFRNMVSTYITARRQLNMTIPKSIEKINLDYNTKDLTYSVSDSFLKYILFLDYQMLSAHNSDEGNNISKWFSNFEKMLMEIYDCPCLKLKKDAKNLQFKISMPNYEPFGLNEMADGYSALLKIIMELMLRMEKKTIGTYDMQGVVLIDEIETHLHVELQKKVLPFLTTMFPNIQFIVTTHSPFVIESLKGAVVYDLERQERNVITEAKSANETVRDMLGVAPTMPVWAEQKLNAITEKYMLQSAENISFDDMKKELDNSGLSSFFPESMASVLRGQQ